MEEVVDVHFTGICQSMCPESEIRLRLTNDLVHYFERPLELKQNERCSRDRLQMVKEFRRPAPGTNTMRPADLRPACVLLKTINYLFDSIVPRCEVPWCRVYDFVFDRLRAVRQDMVIQRITGNEAIQILELNVRFLIYAGYRLCMESRDDFDPEINRSHVQECLKRLLVLYAADGNVDRCHRGDSADDSSVCRCHQGEFVALYLLYNLGSDEALLHALNLRQQLHSSDVFKVAFSLCLAWNTGNFVRVLRLTSRLPGLHQCALHRHIDRVRCHALNTICAAIGSRAQTLSVASLSKWLTCDVSDTEHLCLACGLAPVDSTVSLARAKYKEPAQKICRPIRQIDSQLTKESRSVPHLLRGKICELHCQTRHVVET